MSVHQLKDGRWIVRYQKGKDKARPTTNKKYFGRGPEAERAAIEFNLSLGLGARKTTSSPTFTELCNSYLEAKANTMADSSYRNLYIKLERIIVPRIGNMQAHQIVPTVLDQYVAGRSRTVKNTTIHRELSDIRAILRWSVKRRLLAHNPMEGFEMPKRDDAIIMPPSKPEFDAIVKAAAPHLKRALIVSYYTGLRPGKEELLSLTWDAVDFHNKTIQVISARKGGLPQRMVPLHHVLYDHLDCWYEGDIKDGIRYIVHYHGHRVDSIKKAWKAAKKRARVTRRLRLYDLRHAFATDLLRKGVSLKTVSELLGHSDPGITAKVYQHVSASEQKAAINLLE